MAFTGNYVCDSYRTAMLQAGVNFAVDTIKLALYTDSASLDANTTAYTTDGEVIDVGYTAGGVVLSPVITETDGVSYVSFSNVSWSGAITARGALIYKNGGTAICVLDFGANKTSSTTFTVEFPPATAVAAIIRIK